MSAETTERPVIAGTLDETQGVGRTRRGDGLISRRRMDGVCPVGCTAANVFLAD